MWREFDQIVKGKWTFGDTPHAGVILGFGTASKRKVINKANAHFISLFGENQALSGDNRLIYARQYLTGAGSGGECLRAFNTIGAACGTAHGAHISLNFGAGGALSGLGVGCRSTLHIPEDAALTGTLAGGQSEIYCDGTTSTSDPGSIPCSIHRFVVDGDATAAAKVKAAFEFAIAAASIGQGPTKMVDADQNAKESTDGLRILINGTPYWILMTSAASA